MAIPVYTVEQLDGVRRISDIVYVSDAVLPLMFWINAGTTQFLAINVQKFYDLLEGGVSREAVLDVKTEVGEPATSQEGDIWVDPDTDEAKIRID